MSIALLAAEPSGDLQGAALARALRQIDPTLDLFGVGSVHMRQAGVELLDDSSVWSVVGLFEAIPKIPEIWVRHHLTRIPLRRRQPALTVMIDAPAIHMRLANYLRDRRMRSAYYFPPSAWTHNSARLAKIHGKVDAVIPTFAFNAEGYRQLGLEVAYFGHPLVDLFSPLSPEEARRQLGFPAEGGPRLVALMPGSRVQEIKHILPTYLEVARRLRRYDPHMQFLLPVATPALLPAVERAVGRGFDGLHRLSGQAKAALAASELALIGSGSATLEAALLGTPMVLCYRANLFDYYLYRLLVGLGILKIPRWGLPNLVLQEDVIPEIMQKQATPGNLTRLALDLLESGAARQRQVHDLGRVRDCLGRPGVVARVAQFCYLFAQGMGLTEARCLADQAQI